MSCPLVLSIPRLTLCTICFYPFLCGSSVFDHLESMSCNQVRRHLLSLSTQRKILNLDRFGRMHRFYLYRVADSLIRSPSVHHPLRCCYCSRHCFLSHCKRFHFPLSHFQLSRFRLSHSHSPLRSRSLYLYLPRSVEKLPPAAMMQPQQSINLQEPPS